VWISFKNLWCACKTLNDLACMNLHLLLSILWLCMIYLLCDLVIVMAY
jgi:hypothetical protein